MGLDCSHDAFHGAYSAFNRFRKAVAEAVGGSYPPHFAKSQLTGEYVRDRYGSLVFDDTLDATMWYWDDEYSAETNPGLYEFLCHSDCDGEISPEMCVKVADELEALLPILDEMESTGGHLDKFETMGNVARQFIAGCRAAADNNEPLEFY